MQHVCSRAHVYNSINVHDPHRTACSQKNTNAQPCNSMCTWCMLEGSSRCNRRRTSAPASDGQPLNRAPDL
eukprot:5623760-Alexandrium_andersonii.AAC.1